MWARWISSLALVTLVSSASLGAPPRVAAQGNALLYLGGPIMGDPTVYTIFWLPPGQHFEQDASRDTGYEDQINGFITDLDGSPYLKILDQYSNNAKGKAIKGGPITGHVTLGGTWVDAAAYPHAGTPADPVLAADLLTEIERAMAANGWSPGLHKVYAVYFAAHINFCSTAAGPCTKNGLEGAHYALTDGDFPLLAIAMPDAASFASNVQLRQATTGAPAIDPYAGLMASPTAHELSESVTDPMVGVVGTDGVNLAWYRASVFGSEIADVCQKYATDMKVGAHVYLVPALYSNARRACVFSDPALPLHLKLAATLVREGKKQTLTIITRAGVQVALDIEPGGRVVRAHADGNGMYTFRWTPKRATLSRITVTAAANDGHAGLRLAKFKVQ